jgi:hypothetical protein
VYEEAVLKGKRELYEDAFELEKILKNMNVETLKTELNEKAEGIIKGQKSMSLNFYPLEGSLCHTPVNFWIEVHIIYTGLQESTR